MLLLARAKQSIAARLVNLPNITCSETVVRHIVGVPAHADVHDKLQFEVAYIGARELYSVADEHEFSERRLAQLAGSGIVANGDYVSHAKSVFVDHAAVIRFGAYEIAEGKKAAKFTYRIPLLESGWVMTDSGRSGRVASHGAFWVDTVTLNLLRLDFDADEIPGWLPFRTVHTSIRYGMIETSRGEVLVPVSTDLEVTQALPGRWLNHTTFQSCREFRAESGLVPEK